MNFEVAYIGGTFDAYINLFQLATGQTLANPGTWSSSTTYLTNTVVVASDNNAYVALSTSTSVNPVTDGGVHWALATGFDLTNYSASMPIGVQGGTPIFTLTSGSGLTLGGTAGTVVIKATPTQTTGVPLSNRSLHYYLQITNTSDATDVYFPVGGSISFFQP